MADYYPLTEKNSKMKISHGELIELKNLELAEEPKNFIEESLKVSVTNWNKAISMTTGKELSLGLKRKEDEPQEVPFYNDGLINEFARLRTYKEIEMFSNRYGLLGIKEPDARQIHSPYRSVQYTVKPSYIFNSYGFSVFEPMELWLWHINEVRQILKLYDAVRKNSSENRLNEIISINRLSEKTRNQDDEIFYVKWGASIEQIVVLPKILEEKPMLEIGQYTLSKVLQSHISGGIRLDIGDLVRNPKSKGFKVIEQRYTPYLLAAIYYDLWQNINDDRNIYICENPNCGATMFKSSRRKKYCRDACKQEAYRIRLAEERKE